jgi:hypothetical protein
MVALTGRFASGDAFGWLPETVGMTVLVGSPIGGSFVTTTTFPTVNAARRRSSDDSVRGE